MSGETGEGTLSNEPNDEPFIFNFQILKAKPSDADSIEEEEDKSSPEGSLLTQKNLINTLVSIKDRDENLVRMRKRSHDFKQSKATNFNDKDIRLKEIIEDRLSGIPTKLEKKKREERIENLRKNRRKSSLQLQEQDKSSKVCSEEGKSTVGSKEVPLVKKEETFQTADIFPKVILRDGKPIIDQFKIEPPKKVTPEVNTNPKRLNSKSFKEQNSAAKWSPDETRKFYKALEFFGADFSMISMVIKDRTREQLKNKFHKEEKLNGEKVNAALLMHKNLDVMTLLDQNTLPSKHGNGQGGYDDMDREIILELSKTLGNPELIFQS